MSTKLNSDLLTGSVVQVVQADLGTTVASSVTMNTTPIQVTDGVQLLSISFTPKSSTSRLFVDAVCTEGHGGSNYSVYAALFRDSSNAFASNIGYILSSYFYLTMPLGGSFVAGSVSPTTIQLRMGGTGQAWSVYGTATTSKWMTYLRITEVAA